MRRAVLTSKRRRLVLVALAVIAAAGLPAAGPAGTVPASTLLAPHADAEPPSVPQGMAFSGRTGTTVSLVWRAATDNVGVVGYRLFKNDRAVATAAGLRHTYRGLRCGTRYTFALEAYDAAGNTSYRPEAAGSTSTSPCVTATTPKPRSKPKPAPPARRPTPPRAGTANVWVDPNGGSCTRRATEGAYGDAQSCAGLAAAYNAAASGDTIVVTAGVYGPQVLRPGTKKLTIRNAPGVVPVLGTTIVEASNITLIGFKVERNDAHDDLIATLEARGANNIFDGVHVNTKNVYGRQGIHARGNNNTFRNGSTYNVTDEKGAWISGNNVTFDNFNFYNTYATASHIHNECAYVIGANGFTIRNSKFWRCPTMALYLTRGSWYGAPPWGNVTVENNVFGHSTDTGRDDSWHYYGFVFSGALSYDGAPLNNFKVRYNTFEQPVSLVSSLRAVGASEFVGNLGGGWDCVSGMTYRYNVGEKCSPTDKAISPASSCGPPACASPRTASLGWSNPEAHDFHLTPKSPAINAGDPNDHPRTDKDGRRRPAGSRPDAGAYEYR